MTASYTLKRNQENEINLNNYDDPCLIEPLSNLSSKMHCASLILLLTLIQCLAISSSSGSNLGLNGGQVAAGSNGLQCQRISVSACQGLGYNMTALPNLAGHTNQLEAELQVREL